MTVGLAMLVKDEAETLPATLPRMLEAVDAVTIMDTGSTDDTVDVALRLTRDWPTELVRRHFDGFGPSRSALLAAARGRADYTLMLDADHRLNVHGERPELTADSYLIKIEDGWGGRLPLLTRSSHPFEYRGVAHAYLASDQQATRDATDWISVEGGPGASREKLERDRELLTAEHMRDPTDARTVFYLAQTYRDLGHPHEAIAFYRMRAGMVGFDEETYYAQFQLGVLTSGHIGFSEGADELLKAWRMRPHRVEALRELARHAEHVADKYPVPADDYLFVSPTAYKGSN